MPRSPSPIDMLSRRIRLMFPHAANFASPPLTAGRRLRGGGRGDHMLPSRTGALGMMTRHTSSAFERRDCREAMLRFTRISRQRAKYSAHAGQRAGRLAAAAASRRRLRNIISAAQEQAALLEITISLLAAPHSHFFKQSTSAIARPFDGRI